MGGLSEKTLNYQHLSEIYDAIMGDPEGVKLYVAMLQNVLVGSKILDLACGTGDLTLKLSQLGFDMTGLDLSEPMLEIAKGKDEEKIISFICGNMLTFELNEVFDSIVCANDSVNYCSSLDQLTKLFKGVNRHLPMGGVFVFDYHQKARLEEFGDPFDEEGRVGDIGYHWHIESDPPVLRHIITLYSNGYPIIETHEQFVFDLMDIQELLREQGFECEVTDPADVENLYLDEKWIIKAQKERDV
ncbi:MAG: methyltransferase domain-containing protein [Erysipelotrichaceae bacterium]|nr:methyltransferase domain-containing protein [Erysipelotrichaceae bacterium]